MNYFEKLKEDLNSNNLPYRVIEEGVIEIFQTGKNAQGIRIVLGFNDPNKKYVWFKCFALGHFDESSYASGLLACNDANKQYRWIRFFIDSDNDVVAAIDAMVSEETVFSETIELIARMIKIIDELYPTFMKARWS